MTEPSTWYQEIRAIHDRHFNDPWQERANAINRRFNLPRPHMLLTHGPGVPMPWFNGDIERIEPGHWVLVISLNHQINPDKKEALDQYGFGMYTPDTYWEHWRTFNTEHWYPDFFAPLVRIASGGLGETVPREQEFTFPTNRMLFSEICPYGSNKFGMSRPMIEELQSSDMGFQLAAKINHVLITKGRPALVLVNGNPAVDAFHRKYIGSLRWQESRYPSTDSRREGRKKKFLRHKAGFLALDQLQVPVVGFPFLRTPRTHNSVHELGQLSRHIRTFLLDAKPQATPSTEHRTGKPRGSNKPGAAHPTI